MKNSTAETLKTVLNRAGDYSRLLGRVPASIYTLLFAALIFGCTIFYWIVTWLPPGQAFRYAGEAAVQDCQNKATTLETNLTGDLQAAYVASGQANQVVNGWRMRIDRALVSAPEISYPRFAVFSLQIPFNNGTPEVYVNDVTVAETVILDLQQAYFIGDMAYVPFSVTDVNVNPYWDAPRVPVPTIPSGQGSPSANEPEPIPTGIPVPSGLPGADKGNVLPLSSSVYRLIMDVGRCQECIAAGCTPFPPPRGTFAQMLGLSARTASLLPLTDATPASALASVILWPERILGAILLALILNSFGYEIARTSRTGLSDLEPDAVTHKPASKRPAKRTAKGSSGTAASRARPGTQTPPPTRISWSDIWRLAKRGCILVVAGATFFLVLAILYAAGLVLLSLAEFVSKQPPLTVPRAPAPSLTAPATSTTAWTATPIPTPTGTATPMPTGTATWAALPTLSMLEPTKPAATRTTAPLITPYPAARAVQGDVIAFRTSDTGHTDSIWIANADGSGEKQLVGNIDVSNTPLRGSVRGLQWSPDGKWISYVANNAIWVVAPDGSLNKNLVSPPGSGTVVLSSLSWSPESSRIAYALTPEYEYGPRHASIAIVDVSSGQVRQLGGFDYGYSVTLSWTPDGQGLWLNSPGGPLLLLDPETGNVLKQTPNLDPSCAAGDVNSEIWSPNGKWIATVDYRYRSGIAWLCVYTPGGEPVVPHGQSMNPFGAPSCNPAGNALYFVARPAGRSMRPPPGQDLMRFDVSTGTVHRLLPLPTNADCAWEASLSPDGRTLEVHCRDGGAAQQSFLFLDLQTLKPQQYKAAVQLPNVGSRDTLVEWSSDGRKLLFAVFVQLSADSMQGRIGPYYSFYALDVQTGQLTPVSGAHIGTPYWAESPVPVQP